MPTTVSTPPRLHVLHTYWVHDLANGWCYLKIKCTVDGNHEEWIQVGIRREHLMHDGDHPGS